MSAEDDLDLLAAELALGLLEAGEAAAAQARLAQDPELAAAHARWTGWAAGLAADLETPPPARVWSTIAARLPANDDGTLRRQLRLWQGTAIAASLAAVVLGLGWWSRPQPAPVVQVAAAAPPIVAVLRGGAGVVSVSYDPQSRRLATVVAGIVTGPRVAELWVIPADGRPRSLGVLSQGHPGWRSAPARAAVVMGAGMTLAVSLEPQGGSPTGLPTGPVILTGKLAQAT